MTIVCGWSCTLWILTSLLSFAGYNFRAGPNFKNIMFKDERIAYEISMNDIVLMYAANDPVAGNVNFMDATFGNGKLSL